ncbi:hypothetical protein B0T18DRAFT_400652 [Schizothecium vesticola]|uniref:Mid2 domain-containing protein n=1 Tax=Schizothecium vesticola TaxID=314040 RepID=A0AA40FC58_9PEZI|nr:hypothetical protein B0T18DRAFT_400652 [Schizothecium vesticola]
MRLQTAMAALGLASSTMAKISFINPPQFGARISPSQYDVWMEGQTIDIQWTAPEPNRLLSVVLYQMNATLAANYNGQFPGDDPPFEFITHDQVNQTFFRWIVGTTRDLGFSNQFAIAVWVSGTIVTDSATNIFNITSRVAAPSPNQPSGKTSSSLSPSPSPSASGSPPPDPAPPSSSGLSAGASAGIGIGAALGLMALAAAVWFLVRRRRQQAIPGHVDGSPQTGGTESPMAPEKLGHFQNPATIQAMKSRELGLPQATAEMPPESRYRHELPTGR